MADANATKVLPENDPRGGIGIMPGWFTLVRGAVETGVGVFCSVRQFMSTYDIAIALYTGYAVIPHNISTQDIPKYIANQMPTYDTIAFTIALIIQVVFLWSALPSTGIWSIMRRQHGTGHTFQSKDVHTRLKTRKWVMIILFVLDALTDAMFASPGTATIPGTNVVLPAFNLSPVLIVSLLYAVCMWFGSTFVFINGIQCLGAFVHSLGGDD